MNEQAEQIASLFEAARADTLRIFDLARRGRAAPSPGFGYRPIIWHLAHIGVFEAYWLLQKPQGLPAPDALRARLRPHQHAARGVEGSSHAARDGRLSGARARARARYLDGFDFDEADPLKRDGYLFHLVLEHERQHQETLAYLVQLLDPCEEDAAGLTQIAVSAPDGTA